MMMTLICQCPFCHPCFLRRLRSQNPCTDPNRLDRSSPVVLQVGPGLRAPHARLLLVPVLELLFASAALPQTELLESQSFAENASLEGMSKNSFRGCKLLLSVLCQALVLAICY